jgi:hypothetical protein
MGASFITPLALLILREGKKGLCSYSLLDCFVTSVPRNDSEVEKGLAMRKETTAPVKKGGGTRYNS